MLIEILDKGTIYVVVKNGVHVLESKNVVDISNKVFELMNDNEYQKYKKIENEL
jgi:hypothetical protein